MIARAAIREGGVWAGPGTSLEWSTAIDVIDQFGIVLNTVYVPATEEWEPVLYQNALMNAGWKITSDWKANRIATIRSASSDEDDDGIDLDRAYRVVRQLRFGLPPDSEEDKLARELQSVIEHAIERQADAYLAAQDHREGPIARDD